MPDIQRNGQFVITTSATTAPAPGTVEVWSVNPLATGIRTLQAGETYALVDATTGATASQQSEVIRITAATAGASSITVTRGCDATTPVGHSGSSTFNIVVVAGSFPVSNLPTYAQPPANYLLKNANSFSNLFGIYNYKSSNTRVSDQGLANAMLRTGGMTNVLIIGDSVSVGCTSAVGVTTFDRLGAWPLAMRDQLSNGGVPANGTGFIRIVDATFQDARWTNTVGTWANFSNCAQATSLNAAVTLNPDRSGTVFDFWYYDSAGGTFTVSVDGAASGPGFKTVTASGSAGWKYIRLYGVNIIGGFSKIVITLTVVGTSGLFTSGGSVWTPNAGLIVHNVAQSGATAFGTGNAAWADPAALGMVYKDVAGRKRTVTDAASSGTTLTSATAAFTTNDLGTSIDEINLGSTRMWPDGCFIGAFISSTQVTIYQGIGASAVPVTALSTLTAQSINIGRDPSLVHIVLGGNDMTAGTTDAQIGTAMTTIRNVFPNSDAMLHLGDEFNPAIVSSARELTFQTALYALADTLDVPLYDWRDRIGTYANGSANGVYGDNAAHLTAASYASIGSSLSVILGPGTGRGQTSTTPVNDNDNVPLWYINRRKTKTATATALTTVETVVLSLPVPANTFAVNDVLRYAMWLSPAATTVTTVRVHIGPLGTIADPSLIIMSATAATNAGARYCEGQTGIQAIGATASHVGGGTETVGAIPAAGVATTATGTFDSTVRNYVTVTVQNGTSTTTSVKTGILEFV